MEAERTKESTFKRIEKRSLAKTEWAGCGERVQKNRTKLVYGGLQAQVRGFVIYLKEMGICEGCEQGG